MSQVWGALSPQAQISLVMGVLVAVVAGSLTRDPETGVSKSGRFNWSVAATVAVGYVLVAYNSNCLTVGRCEAWSWVSILAPVLMGMLFLWAAVF